MWGDNRWKKISVRKHIRSEKEKPENERKGGREGESEWQREKKAEKWNQFYVKNVTRFRHYEFLSLFFYFRSLHCTFWMLPTKTTSPIF